MGGELEPDLKFVISLRSPVIKDLCYKESPV